MTFSSSLKGMNSCHVNSVNLKLPKKGLHIAHVNVNSLVNKVDEILNVALTNNLHIFALTETHLHQSINDGQIKLKGFNVIRKDRNKKGGGVALYLQEHLLFKVRNDLCVEGLEILWTQIYLPFQQPILIGCIYRPPKSNALYLDKLCESLDHVLNERLDFFLLGDYNINFHNASTDGNKARLTQYLESHNLSQMVKDITRSSKNRMGHKTESIIDLIICNVPNKCSRATSTEVAWTDHNIVCITKKTKVPKRPPRITIKRSYKNFDLEQYHTDLSNVPWDIVCLEEDVDGAVESFNKLFFDVIDKHAPIRKSTVKTKPSPWIDQQLREAISQRNEAKIIASRSGLDSDILVYRKCRNFVVKLNRQKKSQYYKTAFEGCKNNSKQIWNTVHGLLGKSSTTAPLSVEVNGVIKTKPVDIANYFADHFESKVKNIRSGLNADASNKALTENVDKIMRGKNCEFKLPTVSLEQIEKALSMLPENRSVGYDFIDNKLLKLATHYVAKPIKYIFELSLQQGKFPTEWKHAKVCPIPKDNKLPLTTQNSRPISLLPSLSKILERIVSDHIWTYMESNNILTQAQHAYRNGHSTETALLHMTDEWLAALDQGKLVALLLLDFTSAFDLIDHDILLRKLTHYHFEDGAINWMTSYLTGRKQSTYINGSFSTPRMTACGIPQGSCLGPLLYIIYSNDLPLALTNQNAFMFADDTTISTVAHNQTALNNQLSNDLQCINKWVKGNNLVLNASKTQTMVICTTRKRRKLKPWSLMYGNILIKEVAEVKLLGIKIQNNLAWRSHLTEVSKKVMQRAGMISRISKFLPIDILRIISHSLIYSHVSYCGAVWGNASRGDIRRLQITLNKAARIVLRSGFEMGSKELMEKMGWLTIEEYIRRHSIKLISKIYRSEKPEFIYSKLVLGRKTHQLNLRSKKKEHFVLPRIKTEMGRRTFIFRTVKLWNSLN